LKFSLNLTNNNMKKGIHPQFFEDTVVVCSCGNKFTTGSTIKWEIRIESCNKCHPFFTWEKRLLKTSTLDKFQARKAKTQELNSK